MIEVNEDNVVDFVNKFDTFLFDCDGVLWRGNTSIEGTDLALDLLRSLGKKIFFVTNNSSKSREQVMSKIKSFGITCYKDEILSSSYGVAWYLNDIGFKKKAYIIGD